MAVAAKDCFNWGYDPFHFNAPEGSYASDPADAAVRIREFRAMVQALHANGLRVGMDVVYNHTSAAGQHAQSVLDRIVPGYYHRLDASGGIERSTCCENTATEHLMMGKLMIDSVKTWADRPPKPSRTVSNRIATRLPSAESARATSIARSGDSTGLVNSRPRAVVAMT